MISRVETSVRSYEINGSGVTGPHNDADDLLVRSHRLYNDRVVLDWFGKTITVCASDLHKAIENATNH